MLAGQMRRSEPAVPEMTKTAAPAGQAGRALTAVMSVAATDRPAGRGGDERPREFVVVEARR